MKLIVDCPLCKERSMHIIGEEGSRTYQCLNCGMASSDNFSGKKEEHPQYKTLTDEMKSWSVQTSSRWYIPAIITLPFGMAYPYKNPKDEMKWAYAEMKDIPETERENYPIENQPGKFYERRYDTENALSYDTFLEVMSNINEKAKSQLDTNKIPSIPKIKKKDGSKKINKTQ